MNLFTPSFQEGRSTINMSNCGDLYQGGPVRFLKMEEAGLGGESRTIDDQLRGRECAQSQLGTVDQKAPLGADARTLS